jgi:hypothetical protein
MSSPFSRSRHPPALSDNESICDDEELHRRATSTKLVLPAEAEVDDNFLDTYELDAEGNDEQHSQSKSQDGPLLWRGTNPRALASIHTFT